MKTLAILIVGAFLLAVLPVRLIPVRARTRASINRVRGTTEAESVRVAMNNVDFRFTEKIVVHIAQLNGRLAPNGSIPIFDDKNSFDLDLDSATMRIGPRSRQ